MNIDTLIQLMLAMSTIIGGGIAAYATYRNTNASIKNAELKTQLDVIKANRELGNFGVEEAEKISNMSLANAQFMQQQFMNCMSARTALEDEVTKLTLANTQYQVKLMKVVTKIHFLVETHKKLNEEHNVDCPAFPLLQSLLEQMALELEEEALR